jgi:hypothetical protein
LLAGKDTLRDDGVLFQSGADPLTGAPAAVA